MVDFYIDEIIRVMHEKAEDMTYYLHKETGDIIYIDENIASGVEKEYDQTTTVIEEWSSDVEDDDMYHEKIYSPTDELDEKELIKRVRFTKQDDYEPIPTVTTSEMKKIVEEYLETQTDYDEDLKMAIMTSIKNIPSFEEIEETLLKHISDKEKWNNFYQETIKNRVVSWLKGLGFEVM
ncbi:MAG: hypothetical protein JXR69_07625 [Candidatus Delongbacteria bacterium]|nr:hypothetical protein [Candidatus Delongbacteria bacterium]